MGGEWQFMIKPQPSLDVRKWQEELLNVKRKFEGVHGLEEGTSVFFSAHDPCDNIFARFTYDVGGNCRHGDALGAWFLPWDPRESLPGGHIHARCAPHDFKRYSYEIQRHMENKFPDSVLIEWGDGIDGYNGNFLRSRGYRSLLADCPGCSILPPVDVSDLLVDIRTQLGMNLLNAIENADEQLAFALMQDAGLNIDFVAPFHECEEPVNAQKWEKKSHMTYVKKTSAVRLAVEMLVNSPYPVDHAEVGVQLRILRMLCSKDPRLDWPENIRTRETRDLARNVVYDVVGFHEHEYECPEKRWVFIPMDSGIAEVRIRLTMLSMLLPLVKRPPCQTLMGLEIEGTRKSHFDASLRKLLDNDEDLAWILNKKPGWELVKVLQEFKEADEPVHWQRWCQHDGLDRSFFAGLDQQLHQISRSALTSAAYPPVGRDLIAIRRLLASMANPL